jgi:hypothetical protein
MARVKGTHVRDYNNEVVVRKPIDARTLVPSYNDLLLKDNWVKDGTTQVIAYNGLVVSVANTSDTSKNGIYFLFDPNCTTALKSPDVTNEANWHKIGENSDLGDLVDRLEQLESDVSDIGELPSRINELEVTINGEDGLLEKVDNLTNTKADKTDLDAYYTTENANKKFATIEAVDESLSAKADKEDTYTKEELDELQASLVEQINTVDTKIGAVKTAEAPATGLFAKLEAVDDSVAKIVAATDANTAKLSGISGTVLQAIEDVVKNIPALEAATAEKLGGIKSSTGMNTVYVNDEGIASVNTINVNTLTQTDGDMLVLDGGASGVSI